MHYFESMGRIGLLPSRLMDHFSGCFLLLYALVWKLDILLLWGCLLLIQFSREQKCRFRKEVPWGGSAAVGCCLVPWLPFQSILKTRIWGCSVLESPSPQYILAIFRLGAEVRCHTQTFLAPLVRIILTTNVRCLLPALAIVSVHGDGRILSLL